MALPTSWSDALVRLERALRGRPGEAEEWLRQAVHGLYGVSSIRDLPREQRAVCFQKTCGVVLAAEEEGIPDLVRDGDTGRLTVWWGDGTIDPAPAAEDAVPRRQRIAAIFARYFGGVSPAGPPWRLDDTDSDRPTHDDWTRGADFG